MQPSGLKQENSMRFSISSSADVRYRRGFSLVELLVVIAIIAVLIGLLLAAAQAAREASYSTRCKNNLKQIGLACYNACDTYGYYPLYNGWYPAQGPTANSGWGTLMFHLLPFIEQGNLYASSLSTGANFDGEDPGGPYHSSLAGYGTPNFIGAQLLKSLICSSDPTNAGGGTVFNNIVGLQTTWAPSNYAGNYMLFGAPPNYPGNSNTFPVPQYSGFAQLIDGLSNTILFYERYASCDGTNPAFTPSYSTLSPGEVRACLWDWEENTTTGPGHAQWPVYADFVSPYASNFPLPQIRPQVGFCDYGAANTGHPAGTNVSLADGSVRSVAASVSLTTWAAANTPAGGEVLGSDW